MKRCGAVRSKHHHHYICCAAQRCTANPSCTYTSPPFHFCTHTICCAAHFFFFALLCAARIACRRCIATGARASHCVDGKKSPIPFGVQQGAKKSFGLIRYKRLQALHYLLCESRTLSGCKKTSTTIGGIPAKEILDHFV